MPFPEIDPVIFSIGPFAIRWYALAYIAGILLGSRMMGQLAGRAELWANRKPPLRREDVDDLIVWIALGVIIGARLGYVIFYNPSYYLDYPAQILAIWRGGMSFHGGAVGLGVMIYVFGRRRKIGFLPMFDLAAAAAPIGLFLGRISNFINGELWGRVTDVPWGVVFPHAGPYPRHPSQLYEAVLEGPLLFFLLWLAVHRWKALRHPGVTGGLFLVFYGMIRIFVEFFREPDAHIGFLAGGFTMGIALSVPMILLGGALIAGIAGKLPWIGSRPS